jgi:hypothetical protein
MQKQLKNNLDQDSAQTTDRVEVFCFEFAARPIPTDPQNYIYYKEIPVKIIASTRENAEKSVIKALGKPKQKIDCEWLLSLRGIHSYLLTRNDDYDPYCQY